MWTDIGYWLNLHTLEFFIWLAIAFTGGVLTATLFRTKHAKGLKDKLDKGDRAFFKGIHHILSNEPDQAIEQFTKSVQINSDTVETYIALGNLYRSRGDIERAIRIRQGIILRPNLDNEIRLRAIFDLGLDYKKGGFLSRALSAFQEVSGADPKNIGALEQMERIYEDLGDWANAFKTRQSISRLVKGEHRHILAHQQTEMGKVHEVNGDFLSAERAYKKAISISSGCVDAYLHLGDLYFDHSDHRRAFSMWSKVAAISPKFVFLAYQRLDKAYPKIKNLKPVEDFLRQASGKDSDGFAHLALARCFYNKGDVDSALQQLEQAIVISPTFLGARKLMGEILLENNRKEEALAAYNQLLSRLDFPFLNFQCSNCGFKPRKLVWKCPQCLRWDSINIIEIYPDDKLPS